MEEGERKRFDFQEIINAMVVVYLSQPHLGNLNVLLNTKTVNQFAIKSCRSAKCKIIINKITMKTKYQGLNVLYACSIQI